jgi:hypothetical protein
METVDQLTPRQVSNITGWPYPRSLTFCKRFGQRNGSRWTLSSQIVTSLINNQISVLCEIEKNLATELSRSQHIRHPQHERDEEILRLRLVEGWKLIDIGNKFGISSERVRQIVGNTGFLSAEMMREKITAADPMESNPELANRLDVGLATISHYREGWHTIKGDSSTAKGNDWEKWAAEEIEKRGHLAELQPFRTHFDILVDDCIKVDIKSATSCFPPSFQGRMKNPRYSFHLRKQEGRDPIDFFFCIAIESEDVFIIPYDALPMPKGWLAITWPTARPEIGKYQKYHNRWDLLTPQ